MDAVEYSESSTVTLEWTVKGLKNLFDQSKGDLKSKVCKSVKFGGGYVPLSLTHCAISSLSPRPDVPLIVRPRRWQVLFYPNRYDDSRPPSSVERR